MSDHLTVTFTENEDGWVTAQIVEYPAAISQGRNRCEAGVNVFSAMADLIGEDEPVTPEDEQALAEVDADREAGVPRIPFAEIKRKHGPSSA